MIDTEQFDGHTPGPWTLSTEGSATGDPVRWITAGIDEPSVCTDLLGATDADARLIAAAPELLAEVKRLRDWRSATLYHLERFHLDAILHGLLKEADEVEAWANEKRDWYARYKLPLPPNHTDNLLCVQRIMDFRSKAEVIRLIENYWSEQE